MYVDRKGAKKAKLTEGSKKKNHIAYPELIYEALRRIELSHHHIVDASQLNVLISAKREGNLVSTTKQPTVQGIHHAVILSILSIGRASRP